MIKAFFLPWTDGNPYQRNLARALESRGVEVTPCRARRFAPVMSQLWRYGIPDVLHLHWISGFMISRFRIASVITSGTFLLELAVVRLLGVRIVWTIHNIVEHKKRDVRFEIAAARFAAKLCHALFVHSERARAIAARAFAIDDPDDRIIVVPHGHYLENYPDEMDEDAARRRLGIELDSFVYLFFGMLRPYKGIEDLIRAFQSLEDARAMLLVVGSCRDTALGDRLTRAAAADPRIRPVLRRVGADEVQLYMRAANAVVLPFSDVLTSGSAILAMGFGRALVVPQLGCLPDYVDAEGGILFEPGVPGLTTAIREVARSDWRAMGRYNAAVARRLDWASVAARTSAAYRAAASPQLCVSDAGPRAPAEVPARIAGDAAPRSVGRSTQVSNLP